jgi:hypothetical protein
MRTAERAALVLTIAALTVGACAREVDQAQFEPTRTVGGLTVYLGVVPAALIRGHAVGTTDAMHVQEPGAAAHHVMVAVFDGANGARITDAQVTATVADTVGAPETRRLEPMTVAGATTYGNFFDLTDGDRPAAIDVEIARPGRTTVHARFAWRHGP